MKKWNFNFRISKISIFQNWKFPKNPKLQHGNPTYDVHPFKPINKFKFEFRKKTTSTGIEPATPRSEVWCAAITPRGLLHFITLSPIRMLDIWDGKFLLHRECTHILKLWDLVIFWKLKNWKFGKMEFWIFEIPKNFTSSILTQI